jgi:hypothetical protein
VDSGRVTLNQMIATVRQRCDIENDDHITDAEIEGYLRSAVGELHESLVLAYGGYVQSSCDYANASEALQIPGDFWRLDGLDVDLEVNGEKTTLKSIPWAERNRFSSTYTGVPTHYALKGDYIYLFPTPSAGQTVTLWYVPRPAILSSTAKIETRGMGWSADDTLTLESGNTYSPQPNGYVLSKQRGTAATPPTIVSTGEYTFDFSFSPSTSLGHIYIQAGTKWDGAVSGASATAVADGTSTLMPGLYEYALACFSPDSLEGKAVFLTKLNVSKSHKVSLAWTLAADASATGVYRRIQGSAWRLLAVPSAPTASYDDTGIDDLGVTAPLRSGKDYGSGQVTADFAESGDTVLDLGALAGIDGVTLTFPEGATYSGACTYHCTPNWDDCAPSIRDILISEGYDASLNSTDSTIVYIALADGDEIDLDFGSSPCNFSTVIDGMLGYEELPVLETIIKCRLKREEDPSAEMNMKAQLKARLTEALSNRDQSGPIKVSDTWQPYSARRWTGRW